MNIFYLHHDPRICAQYHVDKHVVKMILESVQILCTALHLNNYKDHIPYKATHIKHPCVLWAASAQCNWYWLKELAIALEFEWSYRFHMSNPGKRHKSMLELDKVNTETALADLPLAQWKDPPMAMPDEYKIGSAIDSYRCYYLCGKSHLHSYTKREYPEWMTKNTKEYFPTYQA